MSNEFVVREDRRIFDERLGNEHPVERVFMNRRQLPDTKRVFGSDRNNRESVFSLLLGKYDLKRIREPQFADLNLDCDFPDACYAEQNPVGRIRLTCYVIP